LTKSRFKLNNQEGFSLIEVLVALFVVTIILSAVISTPFSSRQKLDEAISDAERSLRFSTDEATLKNSIIRLHYLLDKEPQEYAVEFGPSKSFILPTISKEKSKSREDQEKDAKKLKKINQMFNRVSEFQDKNKVVPDDVKIIAIGTSADEGIITDFEASVYVYPSGEKDGAIIIFGTEEEVASLSINPFTNDFERKYRKIEGSDTEELEEVHINMAEELYKEWLKD
jgi:prepilin-type N-terminal cleavage/methylation domain-containing protein